MAESVLTFLVTTADDADFRTTLAAVRSQTQDHTLVVVDASPTGAFPHLSSRSQPFTVVRTRGARNFGRAIAEALATAEVAPLAATATYLWFLHADSTPQTDTLEELIAAIDAGPTIGVAGPKQVGPGGELLEVGITATRGGRRLETAAPGEVDQGQYDGRTDVLAVGSAGMLVQREVWQQAGGFDPVLGPFGDGLEVCRRIRRMGYRVVVAPQARIVHHRRSLNATPRSRRLMRRAALYVALMAQPWWIVPFYAAALLIIQPLRALAFLLSRQPAQAWGELGAWLSVVGDSAHLLARRLSGRSKARVPRSALSALETPRRALYKRKQWEAKRVERVDGLAVDPHAAEAIRHHATRTRITAAALSAAIAVVVIVLLGPILSHVLWSDGARLIGPGWADLPYMASDLWSQAWAHPLTRPVDPLAALFALLSSPLAVFGASTDGLLALTLAVSVPLATLSAWALASTVTVRLGVRLSVAAVWVAQPMFIASLLHGQLASTVVHALLPALVAVTLKLIGYGPARALAGEHHTYVVRHVRRLRWWGLSALILMILSAAMPGALIAWLGVALVLSVASFMRPQWAVDAKADIPVRHRLSRLWSSAVPALVLTGPYLWAVVRSGAWAALLVPSGPPTVGAGLFARHAGASPWGAPSAVDILSGLPAPLLSSLREAAEPGVVWGVLTVLMIAPWVALIGVGVGVPGAIAARRLSALRASHHSDSHSGAASYGGVASHSGSAFYSGAANLGVVAGGVGLASVGLIVAALLASFEVVDYHPEWTALISATVATTHGAITTLPAAYADTHLNASEFAAAHHIATPWSAPFLSLAALGLLLIVATRQPSPRFAPWLARVHVLVAAITVGGVMVGSYGLTLPHPLMPLHASDAYSLPTSVSNTLRHYDTEQGHRDSERPRRALVVIPIGQDVYVRELHDNGTLLTDASPLERILATRDPHDSAPEWLTALVTTISTPDRQSALALQAAGVDALVLPHVDSPAMSAVTQVLTRAPGIEPGASTAALSAWRVRPQPQADAPHMPPPPNAEVPTPSDSDTATSGGLSVVVTRVESLWGYVCAGALLWALIASIPRPKRHTPQITAQPTSLQGGTDD